MKKMMIGLGLCLVSVAHAQSKLAGCYGRCVMIEQGDSARAKLGKAPRPDLNFLFLGELGAVEGSDINVMTAECASRARAVQGASSDVRGVLFDFLSIYPFENLKAVVDYQIKQSCAEGF